MRMKKHRGFTLLETVIYIGLFVILIPVLVSSIVRVSREMSVVDLRNQVNLASAALQSKWENDLSAAQQIRVSLSTFGTNPSTLVYVNSSGQTVTIDRPTVTVALPGGNQTGHRLRMQEGASPAVYLTDPDIDVSAWQVDPVRNSSGGLTGLRIHLDMKHFAQASGDPYQKAQFVSDMTIDLQPQTIEN